MDDDLEHPPRLIAKLHIEIQKGFDAVYAVSGDSGSGGGFMRDLFFHWFLKKPPGLKIGSFRIFSRAAADRISEALQPFVYISAELFRAEMKVTSIKYDSQNFPGTGSENAGPSRYSFGSRLRLYMRLLRGYGPFARRRAGEQYEIKEKGGCL